jgi:ribosomal protein L9
MINTNSNPENKAPNPGTKDALKAENESLKAELEAIRAQAEKDAAAKAELEALKAKVSANKVNPEPPVVPDDERVDIHVPKGYANDEPNLLISVNGVNYLLPRGKTSKVPKFIAEEFYRSQKAQEALDKRVDEMLEASK